MASLVLIYVRRGTKKSGPFSEEEVVRRYQRGEFAGTDLAMVDGRTGWHPLSTYIVEGAEASETDFNSAAGSEPGMSESQSLLVPEPESEPMAYSEGVDDIEAAVDERPPRRPFALRMGSLGGLAPVTIAWVLLVLGVIVMVLSRWPWSLYLPLIAAAIVLSVLQIAKNNIAQGVPLLAVALLLPWFVWSQWLSPSRPVVPVDQPLASSTPASVAMPQPALGQPSPLIAPAAGLMPAAPAPAPGDQAPPLAQNAAPVGNAPVDVAPAPPEPPAPSMAEAAPTTVTKGQRVVLAQDVPLFFQNKEFRLGKAGEDFEVLATKADKVYLSTKDPGGRTIAVSTALANVRPAPR